jgi:hypothetical protein
LTNEFQRGAISAAKFNEELSKIAQNQDMSTEDWDNIVDAAISAND